MILISSTTHFVSFLGKIFCQVPGTKYFVIIFNLGPNILLGSRDKTFCQVRGTKYFVWFPRQNIFFSSRDQIFCHVLATKYFITFPQPKILLCFRDQIFCQVPGTKYFVRFSGPKRSLHVEIMRERIKSVFFFEPFKICHLSPAE